MECDSEGWVGLAVDGFMGMIGGRIGFMDELSDCVFKMEFAMGLACVVC